MRRRSRRCRTRRSRRKVHEEQLEPVMAVDQGEGTLIGFVSV